MRMVEKKYLSCKRCNKNFFGGTNAKYCYECLDDLRQFRKKVVTVLEDLPKEKHTGFCRDCINMYFKAISKVKFEELHVYMGDCKKCGFRKVIWKEQDLKYCL